MVAAATTRTSMARATGWLHVLEQEVEGQGQEDEDGLIEQVGDDAQTDQSGVGDDVAGRGGRVAGHVHLGFHKAFGEAAEEADQQVEDAGDAGEALGVYVFLHSPLIDHRAGYSRAIYSHAILDNHELILSHQTCRVALDHPAEQERFAPIAIVLRHLSTDRRVL